MSVDGAGLGSGDWRARPLDRDGRFWPQVRLHLPVVVAALLGVLIALTVAAFVRQWEQRQYEHALDAAAHGHFRALQKGLDEYLNDLHALAALFEASDFVTRDEFEAFAGRLLLDKKAVQNFSWVPLIWHDHRASHEYAGALDGIVSYEIKAVLPTGEIVRSPDRAEYLPIFYSTVGQRNPIYGIDLLSQASIRPRLERARDTNSLSVVPQFTLNSRVGRVNGILFSRPVFRNKMANLTVEDRRKNLMGFAHGAIVVSEAVEHILAAGTTARGLDIAMYFPNAQLDALPLHLHVSRLRKELIAPQTMAEMLSGTHVMGELRAGDIVWPLVAAPAPTGPLAARHDRSWIALLAGLLLAGLATLYLHASIRHAQRLLRANQEISSLARRDALTGLYNRLGFNERLAETFADSRRSERSFALLYFDLDHFKDVNDTLGHPVGDMLLQQVAGRVLGAVRGADIVARLGGDEFAVLQMETDAGMAERQAERINEIVSRPYALADNIVHVTASVGIAQWTAHTPAPEMLLVQADLALYRAKAEGRHNVRFHDAEFDREVVERVSIAEDLRTAIERGEMQLHYQPQVELVSGRVVGAEALLRWRHPVRGMVSPGVFIPIAERSGLTNMLGEWVIDEACRQMRSWIALGVAPDLLGVNISASQFKAGPAFESYLAATLDRLQVPASRIEIELTESVLMEVTRQHHDILERIRKRGVRIAIDDFGTGYSSLNYLSSFPVNRIKIAQELVFGVTTDRRNATIVRAAIGMAVELGIDCIAEGVETAEQAEFLMGAGCAMAQGYHFSRPLDAERMTALLRQNVLLPVRARTRLAVVAGMG